MNTDFSITLKENTIQPAVWRVPTGAILKLTISNRDPVDHNLAILYRTTAALNGADPAASTYWSQVIPAGQRVTFQLQAPAAAGNYEVVGLESLAEGMIARLTAVNVAEVQAISQ